MVSQTATTIRLSVHRVTTAPGQPPIDLILGESINAGWQASVVGGGTTSGDPVLIDGFANGWRLDPSTLGVGRPRRHDLGGPAVAAADQGSTSP